MNFFETHDSVARSLPWLHWTRERRSAIFQRQHGGDLFTTDSVTTQCSLPPHSKVSAGSMSGLEHLDRRFWVALCHSHIRCERVDLPTPSSIADGHTPPFSELGKLPLERPQYSETCRPSPFRVDIEPRSQVPHEFVHPRGHACAHNAPSARGVGQPVAPTNSKGVRIMEVPMTGTAGYVYILEVASFDLPVCKIGMTTRTPEQRCAEINKSSTGDFIWDVKYAVSVNDCGRLEAQLHRDLDLHRQRRREIFQLPAEEAYARLRAILDEDETYREIEAALVRGERKHRKSREPSGSLVTRSCDSAYSGLLQAFVARLQIAARPYGQFSGTHFGVSDDEDGVQWNIEIHRDTNMSCVGVNLEGMKYHYWPISTLIQSELAQPTLDALRATVSEPDRIIVRFMRDAWQMAARPRIHEKLIGGREFSLLELDGAQWRSLLLEARDCLDADSAYRGRATQEVTLQSTGQVKPMTVTPHFHAKRIIDIDPSTVDEEALNNALSAAIAALRPVHTWVSELIERR